MRPLEMETSVQEVMEELNRILESPGFVRNDRLSKFLRLAVEWKLAGKGEELKESVLGVEVFGREAGYDPKRDPVVRTEASRLRARLTEYYSGAGAGDAIVIELPKGGYEPEWRRQARGAAVAPVVASGESRIPSWIVYVMAAMLVVLVAASWRWIETGTTDFFSDGLTGEVIRNLSMIEGLAVRSQASSFVYKNKGANASDSGKELAVDYVLEGSVYRQGNQLRIQVQLVKVDESRYVWSAKYDRESAQVFQIQDEISRGIVNSLRLSLGQGRRRYETSVEAYDLYLRARAMQIHAVFGDPRSIELFEKAIEKDPAFAPAYAGVAIAYADRSERGFRGAEAINADLVRMRETADKAIELDPLLAEAHEARAMSCARDAKWECAEIHFRRAAELDPNDSKMRSHYGCNYYLALGRVEEALEQLRLAEKSDPFSDQVHYRLGYILLSARQFDEAAKQCELMRGDNSRKNQCVGRAKLFQGRLEEAISFLNRSEDRGYVAYALVKAGRMAEAERADQEATPDTLAKAMYWAARGDKQRVLDAVERSTLGGPMYLGRVLTFPEFALVRGEARLSAIYRSIGLPE
jgi:adenylate cyclase